MNLLNATLGVILAVALLLQGAICTARDDRYTIVGLLNLMFATVSLFASVALRSGALVVGTEFGIVLVQGGWGEFFLAAAIIVTCVCAGLFWLATIAVTNDLSAKPFRMRFALAICGLGAMAGLLARIDHAMLFAGGHFNDRVSAIHLFGMWCPPVVLWLAICFSQCICRLLRVKSLANRVLLACLVTLPLALYGLGWAEISDVATSDPLARRLWMDFVLLAFPAAIALTVIRGKEFKLLRRIAAAVCLLAGGSALLWLYSQLEKKESPLEAVDCRGPVFGAFLVFAAAVVGLAIRDLVLRIRHRPTEQEIAELAYRYWADRGRQGGSAGRDWRRAKEELERREGLPGLQPCFLVSLLCLFAFSLFDLFFLSTLAPPIDMVIGFSAWFLLVELVSKGAVSRIPEWAVQLARGSAAPVREFLKKRRERQEARRAAKPDARKDKDADTVWSALLRNTVRAIVAAVLLVVVSEAVHIGNTVIEPFANPDEDKAKERPGDEIANLLVSDLSQVRKDIPELIVISNSGAGKTESPGASGGRAPASVSIASASSNLATAIPGSNELDLFGLKVPMGSVIAIVQYPVRYLFRIEEVSGSLYRETVDKKVYWRAIAVSNRGEVWRSCRVQVGLVEDAKGDAEGGKRSAANPVLEPVVKTGDNREDCYAYAGLGSTVNTQPATPGGSKGNAKAKETESGNGDGQKPPAQGAVAAESSAPPEPCTRRRPQSPIEAMAEDLAFKISMGNPGNRMTDSETAFESFDRGINHLNRYLRSQNGSELRVAIQCFQNAINIDRSFSEAYYRLAQALEKDRQPVRAAAALEAVANDRPIYVRSMLERANALFNLRTYYDLPQPVVVPPVDQYLPNSQLEPLQLWMQVVQRETGATAMERREAYFGICQFLYDEESSGQRSSLTPMASYAPYYFCKRAEALDNSIPLLQRNDPNGRLIEASIQNQIGVSVGFHGIRYSPMVNLAKRTSIPAWVVAQGQSAVSQFFCDPAAIDWPRIQMASKPIEADDLPLQYWSSVADRRALPYFAASQRLQPDDTTIACNYAGAALYSEGDLGPMLGLLEDPRQRVAIGDSLSDMAHEFAYSGQGDFARLAYKIALANYERAWNIDGTSVNAANSRAYGLWSWAVDARLTGFDGPSEAELEDAQAALLARFQHFLPAVATDDYMNAASTLSELNIALGKPKDAAKALKDLTDKLILDRYGDKRMLPPFLYMDMAHANICASKAQGVSASDKTQYENAAKQALEAIQTIEGGGEFRPISDQPQTFLYQNLTSKDKLCFPEAKHGLN